MLGASVLCPDLSRAANGISLIESRASYFFHERITSLRIRRACPCTLNNTLNGAVRYNGPCAAGY